MAATNDTLAKREQHTDSLTEGECHAMRLLAREGWTQRTLTMVFEIQSPHVGKHVNGECWHSPFPIPPKGEGND